MLTIAVQHPLWAFLTVFRRRYLCPVEKTQPPRFPALGMCSTTEHVMIFSQGGKAPAQDHRDPVAP